MMRNCLFELRSLAQSGSASALGAEGRWFESSNSDHLGEVAERFNALVLKTSEGESLPRVRISPSPPLENDMKYKQTGENSWIVEVQQDGKTKELYIEFPPDCINQVGWDVGDTVLWEELPNGNWSLKKKEDDRDGSE